MNYFRLVGRSLLLLLCGRPFYQPARIVRTGCDAPQDAPPQRTARTGEPIDHFRLCVFLNGNIAPVCNPSGDFRVRSCTIRASLRAGDQLLGRTISKRSPRRGCQPRWIPPTARPQREQLPQWRLRRRARQLAYRAVEFWDRQPIPAFRQRHNPAASSSTIQVGSQVMFAAAVITPHPPLRWNSRVAPCSPSHHRLRP